MSVLFFVVDANGLDPNLHGEDDLLTLTQAAHRLWSDDNAYYSVRHDDEEGCWFLWHGAAGRPLARTNLWSIADTEADATANLAEKAIENIRGGQHRSSLNVLTEAEFHASLAKLRSHAA
jgi:hypothetical protein